MANDNRELTQRGVLAAKATNQRQEIRDGRYPLWLVIHPTGTKAWHWRGTISGKDARRVLGEVPHLSLADARAAALEAKRTAKIGEPVASIMPVIAKPTVATVSKMFGHYMLHDVGEQRSAAEKQRMFERDIEPSIGSMAFDQVRRTDLGKIILAKIEAGSPVQADALIALIKRFWNWSLNEGYAWTGMTVEEPNNPAASLKKAGAATPRERSPDAEELGLILLALERLDDRPHAAAIEAVLRTITRRSDMYDLVWSMVKSVNDEPIVDFGITKADHLRPQAGARGQVLWLPPQVVTLMGKRGVPDASVFGADKRSYSHPMGDLNMLVRSLAKSRRLNREIEPFTLHDFRRSATSFMSQPDKSFRPLVEPLVVEKLLAHKDKTVTGVHYNRYEYFVDKKRALELWNAHLDKLRESARELVGDAMLKAA